MSNSHTDKLVDQDQSKILDNIYIALTGTRYAGNIGSTARSMMNFGLKNLVLIRPRCKFDLEAYSRARHAAFIFENAPVYDSLEQFASQMQILVGTSRRGDFRLHERMAPRPCGEKIVEKYPGMKIGILFGDEKAGLSNEDLEKCAWFVSIPTHSEFESLNLSQAVNVIAYEIYMACEKAAAKDVYHEVADVENISHLYGHMVDFLKKVKFPVRGSNERVYTDMKRILAAAELKRTDVNLLHGLMRHLEEHYLGGWI